MEEEGEECGGGGGGGGGVSGEPTLLQTLTLRGEVSCVALAGEWLACGSQRALRVWRWVPGEGGGGWREEATVARAHRYAVTAAEWGAGGAALASGGVDGAVRVWGHALGGGAGARRELAAPGAAAVRALCWPGGSAGRVVAGHDDGAVRVWGTRRGTLLAVLRAHEGSLHALAAPLRGALLLTACTHGTLKLHDMEAVISAGTEGGNSVPVLSWEDSAHDMGALCAAARWDGVLAATGGHDARVRLWQVGRGGLRAGGVLEGHAGAVTSVRWARRLLASASLDGTARLWVAGGGAGGWACLRVLRAHSRYLTAVALDAAPRLLLTASNDRSVRVWSLGALTLQEPLIPHSPCTPLLHFALGDLEGIGSVEGAEGAEGVTEGDSLCAWTESLQHAGSINCVAAHGSHLAAACSDGSVHVFLWEEPEEEGGVGRLRRVHELREAGGGGLRGGYPELAVDFGAGGQILLSAGLDGQATVWDVESGCVLRTLSARLAEGCGGAEGGATGGGGVRCARVSPHRPALLLLATDDGTAPLWSLAQPDSDPLHVYGGHAAAALCCAWSREGGGGLVAVGGAGGELRLHSALPEPTLLHHEREAHDLGVQDCDFAPTVSALELADEDGYHLLLTAGSDCYIKFWLIQYREEATKATVRLARAVWAHGGGAVCVRVSRCGGVAASGGEDRWARVWSVRGGRCLAALPADQPLPALAFLPGLGSGAGAGLCLALGSLSGVLSVWRLGEQVAGGGGGGSEGEGSGSASTTDDDDEEPELATRACRAPGVARWIREYVTRAPDFPVSPEAEAELLRRSLLAGLTGPRLLDDDLEDLIKTLLYDDDSPEEVDEESAEAGGGEVSERARVTQRVRDELSWLRRPLPSAALEAMAPHSLLCPLTHTLMWEPARAPDGFTYDRAHLHEWFLAQGAVSPVTGGALHSARVAPNYRLRDLLREFLLLHTAL